MSALPGAIGAALSLQFVPHSLKTRGVWHRIWMLLFSFVLGSAVSYYVGGAVVEKFHLEASFLGQAVHFCFGLFGLSLVTNAMAEVRPTLISIRDRFLGERKNESGNV